MRMSVIPLLRKLQLLIAVAMSYVNVNRKMYRVAAEPDELRV